MEPCPTCGGTDYHQLLTAADERNHATFTLLRCRRCNLVHTSPLLNVEQLRPYYEVGYWHQTDDASSEMPGLANTLEQTFINFQLWLVTNPLKAAVPKSGKVLDVGTGSGEFMHMLERTGFRAHGIDPNHGSVAHVRQSFGERMHEGTLESSDLEAEAFDAITFIHVLEHVQNPLETIHSAYHLLKPGGALLIEVPHIDSVGFQLFGTRWLGLDVPRHLFHFSESALRFILENAGFQIAAVNFFSFRVAPAYPVVSMFPIFNPMKQRMQGRNSVALKFLYLFLILLMVPVTSITARFRRGETLTILAMKPLDDARSPSSSFDAGS